MLEILAEGERNQTEGLDVVLQQVLTDHSLIPEILKCANLPQANVAARAITVVRRIADTQPKLLADHKRYILNELTNSGFWEVKAELCHIIPQLSLSKPDAESAIRFFEECQKDASRIVRAWSLNGLYEVSKLVPAITDRVSELLRIALNSDVPSISARARNILKEKHFKK